MVPTATIKVRLPVLRAERGLTQRQLAAQAGMRPDTVSALERGDAAGMRFDTIVRLCEALACKPGDLFELVDDGHRVPVFGGDDEDEILLQRLADPVRVDGPSFLEALLRDRDR